MNSRERIACALGHAEPDRVPLDLGGTTGASGIHVVAYARLRRHLGLPERPVRCCDVMQQLAVIDADVIEHFGLDVRRIDGTTFVEDWEEHPLFAETTVALPAGLDLRLQANGDWLLRAADGARFIKPASSWYFDAEDGQGWYSLNPPLTDEFLARLTAGTRKLYESSASALALNFGGGFFSAQPEFMMDLLEEPERVAAELDRKCDGLIERYTRLHRAVGAYTFGIVFADDFGSQAAPLISPELFRELIVPPYRKFSRWLRAKTNWKLYLHSCGAIEPLLEDIIGMGVDILNPVQTSAAGMDPQTLKARYGGRIVFWGGGCDTQRVLGKVPLAELTAHVRERVRILAPGGGFVFNQVHAIQPDVPPADICALLETARAESPYAEQAVG